jgi:hypothetical protein
MEGHGDVLKGVRLLSFVVVFKIHEEGFFVGEVPVVGYVVVHFDVRGTVLNQFCFGSGQFGVDFSVFLDHLELFELFEFGLREDATVICVNWPHLGVCQHSLLLALFLGLYLLPDVSSYDRETSCVELVLAESFGLGGATLTEPYFSQNIPILRVVLISFCVTLWLRVGCFFLSPALGSLFSSF